MSPFRPRRFDERGASAVEYAVLIAAIGAVIIGVVFTLGGKVRSAIAETSSCYASNGVTCRPTAPAPLVAPAASTAPTTAAPAPSASSDDGGSSSGSGNNGNGNSNGNGVGNGKGNSSGK